MVEAIAKLCYQEGIEIGFDKGPEESAAETMRLLRTHETVTLFEATLLSGQKLARVDILRKQGNAFELIEVKAKSVDTSAGTQPVSGRQRQYLVSMAAVSRGCGISAKCAPPVVSGGENSALPLPCRQGKDDRHPFALFQIRAKRLDAFGSEIPASKSYLHR